MGEQASLKFDLTFGDVLLLFFYITNFVDMVGADLSSSLQC